MPEKRRKFSPQFKAEAVQLVVTTGRPVAEVARELQVNEGTLGNWVNTWRRENPEPEPEMNWAVSKIFDTAQCPTLSMTVGWCWC